MFEIGGGLQELLVILVVALLVVGPKRLPEVARALARAMRELRRAQDELRSTVETNLQMNELDVLPAPAELRAAEAVTPQGPASAGDASVMTPHVEPVGVRVEPYLAQRGARLFHSRDCPWATNVKASDRLRIDSEEGATAQGLLPCPVCRPSPA
jgi:Tat protein translocase TatB subunit